VIVCNIQVDRATDKLLCAPVSSWRVFVFQPNDAAYLMLTEPWWNMVSSLALKEPRFERQQDVSHTVIRATADWIKCQLSFVWCNRRRHRPRRQLGIAPVIGNSRLTGRATSPRNTPMITSISRQVCGDRIRCASGSVTRRTYKWANPWRRRWSGCHAVRKSEIKSWLMNHNSDKGYQWFQLRRPRRDSFRRWKS
jgi:hypothetical protein